MKYQHQWHGGGVKSGSARRNGVKRRRQMVAAAWHQAASAAGKMAHRWRRKRNGGEGCAHARTYALTLRAYLIFYRAAALTRTLRDAACMPPAAARTHLFAQPAWLHAVCDVHITSHAAHRCARACTRSGVGGENIGA
jgi:hypothetical protein